MVDLSTLTGPLEIKLVNDYFFRAFLQINNNNLKYLTASLLHMNPSEIKSIQIVNEIVLGKQIADKEFILDIRVLLNDDTLLNIEMQVINYMNWVERSMSYLCRNFDNLAKGDDYINVKPAIQIGLLDYTLFPDAPEFYATYYLMNEKTHKKYSDKLRLAVLDLTRIDLATDEDKLYRIDYWASLFKAKTWEDLKMLAKNNTAMEEAISTIYDISQDSMLREEIRAREERLAQEKRLHEEHLALEKEYEANQKYAKEMESKVALLSSEKDAILSENDRLRELLLANGINPNI